MLLKSFLSFIGLIFILNAAKAQLTKEQRIQDSVIGWWNNNRFDKLKTPTDALGKQKEQNLNKFVEWMKKTYTPVGGLGTVSRYIGKEGYGVRFAVWNVSHDKMWLDEKGNFSPIAEEKTQFMVAANLLPGSYPIEFINKNGVRMFTVQPDGWAASVDELKKRRDPRIDPNAYKYITWTNEWTNIFLAPNNKMPMVAVTRGQLLQAAEDALVYVTEQQRKNVEAQWPSDIKAQGEAMEMRKKTIEGYRAGMHALKDKYKNSLNEPAVVRDMQLTYTDFKTDPDLFFKSDREKELNHYYPVLTLDPAVVNKVSDEKPLWISVSVPFETQENGNQKFEMYTAVTHHLNLDYIYNYFFDPTKIKGVVYTPANAAELSARLNAYRTKNQKALTDKPAPQVEGSNSIFADDFSQNSLGADAANWFYRKQAKHSVIANAPGQKGNWLALGSFNPVMPLLKYPLPQNFSIDFDLASDAGFESRTGGAAILTLNTRKMLQDGTENTVGNGEQFTLNIVSGNEANYSSNYRGVINIRMYSNPSKNIQNHGEGLEATIPLKEFTNIKNKIHVTLLVKNGNIAVSINGREVSNSNAFTLKYGAPCVTCGFAPGSMINSISWKGSTEDAENIKVYLGNVRINKL